MAHALTLESDQKPGAVTLDLVRRLIAFDTVSERSNLELIEFVAGYLDDLGVASELVYDEGHGKANLYATLGPTDRSGIALSGHTDVVPVEGQPWDSDPFEVREEDGRLYGRGTSDMKSFIAVCLALAPEFLARKIATPLHMVFSYDEEVGCLGVRGLIDILRDREVKPRAVFVGEPTEMQVVRAHKGKLSYRVHVRGLEAHFRHGPPRRQCGRGGRGGDRLSQGDGEEESGRRALRRGAGPALHHRAHRSRQGRHSAQHRAAGPATSTSSSGSFPMPIRGRCSRRSSTTVRERIEPELHRVDASTGFRYELLSAIPALNVDEDSEVVQLAKALTGANATGKVSFGTEGGLFQESGMPAVICGPGSIAVAHKANEYIELDQIALCETWLRRLFRHCWA